MAEIKKISDEIREQLDELERNGLALLGLSADSQPIEIVTAITEFVRALKANGEMLDDDAIYAFGALLGNAYVNGLGWHWADVTWDYDETTAAIGVLNPDNSLFTNPIGWVGKVVETSDSVNFLLSYNMISANQVPVFDADSATGLY